MPPPSTTESSRPAAKVLTNGYGTRVAGIGADMIGAFHFVFEAEQAGTWAAVFKQAGVATGKAFAVDLDARFAAAGDLSLASMPLPACLEFFVHHIREQGWGELEFDASDAAEHGMIVARLRQGFTAEALPGSSVREPLVAGMLQGYFEHVTGQLLGCEEISAMHMETSHCTFVLATPDRLQPIQSFIGQEAVEQILARLKN